MSLFDFPRINLTGTLAMNPGTANNDDYAGYATLPEGSGPCAGQTLALIDSKLVEPRTYGMSDAEFIVWVQKAQTFNVAPGGQQQIIPSEWNYYGGMNSQLNPANFSPASVIGVTTAPGQVHTSPDSGIPVTGLLGATLAFSGHFTDVNSEGSPPATQFFIDKLTLTQGSQTWLSGGTSKGACQWLNFYRNVNLTADAGSGGYVYHVILKSSGATINIPGFDAPGIAGVIFRYYLYQPTQTVQSNAAIEALYQQQPPGANSAVIQLVATFAPLYDTETIFTTPVGRLMVANTPNIKPPQNAQNNSPNGLVALAPAVLSVNGDVISADFSGTFPEYQQADNNLKYDFGAVSLVVTNETDSATVAAVSYADTEAGNQGGWLFDFDISANPQAQQILAGGGPATFQLVHATYGIVLAETEYYFVTNQQAIYGEQGGSGTQFVNQGSQEPASVSVFQSGKELAAGSCPPITVWQYASVPLQAPGDAEAIDNGYQPGQPISVKTGLPGNFLFTFTVAGQPTPPASYLTFMNPPYITNWPQLSLRILPNIEDFSQYFVDPAAPEPVGNDLLTFDVVYQKVLRTYYLLYPAMNQIFALNSESAVTPYAKAILDATSPAKWMQSGYMPRTRDMSNSRRTLLQAWCRKILPKV
jgi:hypothetical protein